MFLILAIEPDRRQASRLGAIAKGPLRNAELVTVDSVEAALALLDRQVPDLVLTSMLLSAKDDAALAERLRKLDTAGRQMQTLVIPLFAAPRKGGEGGLLARFSKAENDGSSHGCQPAVFAGQINEYLENLQLDREAREMRQPAVAAADALYTQPTVSEAASAPAKPVPAIAATPTATTRPTPPPAIAKEPAQVADPPLITPARPSEEEPTAITTPPLIKPARPIEKEPAEIAASTPLKPARPTEKVPAEIAASIPIKPARPIEKEPAEIAASTVIKPAQPNGKEPAPALIKPGRPVESARPVLKPHAEPTPPAEPRRVIEPPRAAEPARTIEPRRVIEPARAIEPRSVPAPRPVEPAATGVDTPTAEPPRLIAPSPIAASRHDVTKPNRAEAIVKPAAEQHDDAVAEPVRLIAPSPMAEPPATPLAAVRIEAPESPRMPSPPVSPPAAPAKAARPKVAKVVPPPLHEDPEVARFMAALNELTVEVVETNIDDRHQVPPIEDIGAASNLRREPDVHPTTTPRHEPAVESEAPRQAAAPPTPKTVKALKPARPRAISPAAAPPPLPASPRKRVTPIRRTAPALPDPAPQAPPGIEEPAGTASSAPVKVVGRIQPASSAPPASIGARTGKQKSPRRPRPLQDEWGVFDPDQAGLPAVQAALEDIEEPDIFRNVSTPPKPRG
jgi:CheY-like chemotaxis protein